MVELENTKQKTLSHFCATNVLQTIKVLDSGLTGLTQQEAENRIKLYGKNVIKEEKKLHLILQFLTNFKNPLVLILICIAFFSFITGEVLDGILVLVMILMSVTLNFYQEYKANKAAELLKKQLANFTTVLRDGKKIEVLTSDICIGDILSLNAGDLIPADCQIIESKDLFINQSSLTGESAPIEKHAQIVKCDGEDLSSMTNLVFHGTSVVTGTAKVIVIKTGSNTVFGKIAETLTVKEEDNEFTKGINSFTMMIVKVIIIFVVFIFITNTVLKHDILGSLVFAIAVAVGLTPEFLPMVMAVTMGKGSINMAKKGVIVKKLTSIPTFGSIDILCTDKTGTLTQDKIQLVKYIDVFGLESKEVLLNSYLNSKFQTGITNPMDAAILSFQEINTSGYSIKDEIPFDFNRKRMSVVVNTKEGKEILITKGTPENVFECCTKIHNNDPNTLVTMQQHEILLKQYLILSNEGYRVLALAQKEIIEKKAAYSIADENNLELLGFVAFLDPAKPETKEAINELEDIGIEIKIITGDNELVTRKICNDVGINIKGVMLSQDMHKMSEEEFRSKLNNTTIFARFSPDDKNRVIKTLKSMGHVVGYMGDGINDAPSLKTADVGISVSNAVDVAKESADIVLTDKSLHQLKDGVIEGRKTFGNTIKYIMMGISSNFGNMFSVLGAVLFLPFLPMLPIQILLNNFLYDISQITIPTDNVDPDFIKKPKRWNMKFIRNFMVVFGPISSFYDYASFFVLYWLFKGNPVLFQTGWFFESLATQVLVVHVIRTNLIPFIQSRSSKYLLWSTVGVVIIGFLITYTKIGGFFGFSPIPMIGVAAILVIVSLYLVTVEFAKRIFFQKYFEMS